MVAGAYQPTAEDGVGLLRCFRGILACRCGVRIARQLSACPRHY